ncbi:RN219 protein, partial [Alectura lathami]|nr:RN219 protein [Alectura lathami]
KVRHPVICVNNHVFCSICIEVWLKNNNQCPACRIPITPENPCKEIIGGSTESDPIFSPTVRKHLRKTRLELLHKEYEDEIESLQKEVEELRGRNLDLQTQMKSLLDPTASALCCQNEETSQSADVASTSGPETPEEWNKKLKAANDICEKVIDNVEKLKEANKKLSMENNSLLRENLRLKAEVDSRSPQKFGRFTIAALQSKVEQSEREMNRLKKALERSDKYIEEMECQLLQLKSAGEGAQTMGAVSEQALSADAKGTESDEDATCLKTQAEEKNAVASSQSPDSLEQLTGGGTCSSSSSQDGSNSSNTQCVPKKELFPGCQEVHLDENTANMDTCSEQEWNKIEECTPYKDEELYDLPAPCTPVLSLSRLQLNTPDGKENTEKPSTFLRKLKFEEFCDTSDDCSKDSPEHSTGSEKKLNCFSVGKSGFWGTGPTDFAENLGFDESAQNSVAGQSDETSKSSDKTSSCLPKRLHTLCSSEMNRTRTSSEASMDAAYLDKISELDSMMSESDNSKSPCYNFKSSDLDNSSKSTECSKLLNETEKKLEGMNEEQSMKCSETSEQVDRTGWKPAMFSILSPSGLDRNDHFPLFTGQNVAASEIKPPNCLFQREFSQSLLFSNSQRLFEEQKFGSCFLKMSSDLHNPPWVPSFIAERKNKNVSQSTKRKIQSSLSSASPSKTTKN